VFRSLTGKLTLAFLLVALTVALLVGAFLRFSTADQLDQLIVEQQRGEFREVLVDYYQATGGWEGVNAYLGETRGRYGAGPHAYDPDAGTRRGQERRDRSELFGLADGDGIIVVPLLPDYAVGTRTPAARLAAGEAVLVDGVRVGTILTAELAPSLNPEETAYLRRTNAALLFATAGAVLIALLVGVLLARTLTQPLRALTQASHRMAGGDLEQAVTVTSRDEIGELTAAFNQMSREVARANQARRQMTADVAHELRTPLTVIAGYIEAMQDGVLAATPDRLAVIYGEIERLQHLVGDLRTLAQADTGELQLDRQPLSVDELLQSVHAAFEHQAQLKAVTLSLEVADGLPLVDGDEVRLGQVLGNLLSNALRYTPPGGSVTLRAEAAPDRQVRLSVQDTGPGIAPADLPHIFERFYRADPARAAEAGESGLGLAIARTLVDAHGGRLMAESTPGQGATFALLLPTRA